MKRVLKRVVPSRIQRFLRRYRKRRGFDTSFFIARMLQMHQSNTIPDSKIDIAADREAFLRNAERLKASLSAIPDSDRCIICLSDLIVDVQSNRSLDKFSSGTWEELWLFVLDTLRDGNIDQLQEQLVLVLQLYTFSQGNPLDRMNSMKLFNGAWRNGSVEGYPFILMLDSLIAQGFISRSEGERLYRRTVPPIMRVAEEARLLGREGDNSSAIELFSFVSKTIFSDAADSSLHKKWIDTFEAVTRHVARRSSPSSISIPPGAGKIHPEKARYIVVSGMGWSGSGAVFAALREFYAVRAVKAEFQHLSGVASLRSVRQALASGDTDAFEDELFRLFILSLFGFGAYSDYQEYRSLILANRLTIGTDKEAYVSGVQRIIESLFLAVSEKDESRWNDAAEYLLQAVGKVSMKEVRDRSFVMFDNVIKTYRMTEIDYLEHGRLITTVRDPRSTYVALYHESVKFQPDVNAFIRSYRAKRLRTDQEYEKVVHSDRVIQVQFEDFVTSEEYRIGVVKRLGLVPDERDVHRFFRPWESEKNTRNFKDFPDQSAIRTIEKKLPEYLWNPPETG